MKSTKPHELAIEILREEMFKVGGRMFAEASLHVLAENGRDDATQEINMLEFAKKLFGGMDTGLCDEERFRSLAKSIIALVTLQKQTMANNANSADHQGTPEK